MLKENKEKRCQYFRVVPLSNWWMISTIFNLILALVWSPPIPEANHLAPKEKKKWRHRPQELWSVGFIASHFRLLLFLRRRRTDSLLLRHLSFLLRGKFRKPKTAAQHLSAPTPSRAAQFQSLLFLKWHWRPCGKRQQRNSTQWHVNAAGN